MWYIIAGILVVSVIIIVHEFGHFIVAKLTGMPVEVVCLGYGKPIIKKEWGGTIYGIGPFPFGGYIKTPGMDPREIDILPDEEKEGFVLQPFWKRALMVVGGPIANVFFAILIYLIVFMIGVPGVTTTIDRVEKGSPAQKAGIAAGDKILKVGNTKVAKWEDFVKAVQGSKSNTVLLSVKRGSKTVILRTKVGVRNGVRYLGVVAKQTDYNVGMGFFEAISAAVIWTLTLIYKIFESLGLLVTGKLPFRPMSPVGIVQVTSQAAQHGSVIFLNFVAFISVAIGATNLVPIFPLDGARLVIWIAERLRKKRLADWAVLTYQYAGVGLLLLVTIWAVYLDIFKAIPDPFK
jgi:regulator of sigma E protease